MKKVIIYRFSKNPRYESAREDGSWFEVTEQLDGDEFYLFKEVWKINDTAYYKMDDSDFVKVVNRKWLEDHNLYYGCKILNDDEYSTDDITEYDKEIYNLIV